MLNLIQAVRLLGLNDDELINFCTSSGSWFSICTSVKRLRQRADMKAIRVYKISPHHDRFDIEVSWEFVIAPEDMDAVRKASWY